MTPLMFEGAPVTELRRGDHVILKDDGMVRVRSEAVVVASYHDQYGGKNDKDFTVFKKGLGEASWYRLEEVEQMIARDQTALIDQWRAERDALDAQQSDLQWIIDQTRALKADHPKDWYTKLPGTSYRRLAADLGSDLWGPRGEGIDYLQNLLILHQIWLMASDDVHCPQDWLDWIAAKRREFEAKAPAS